VASADGKATTLVPTLEGVISGKRTDFKGLPFKQITFKDGGSTDSAIRIWL
jgi:hypothetical protein